MTKKEKNLLLDSFTEDNSANPVECLGITFPSDEARRHYFLDKLREKLKDEDFRKTPGFPIGHDEDILALSDPPYYTACPNPFLTDVIAAHPRSLNSYKRDPFASDVSAGKSDAAYNVHAYPTKVPPDAISPLVAHYTDPNSVILDPFSGTGMTGVATQRLGQHRLIVLNDLSPLAAHISNAMTLTARPFEFITAADNIMAAVYA